MESSVMEFQAEGYKFKLLNIRKKILYTFWNRDAETVQVLEFF